VWMIFSLFFKFLFSIFDGPESIFNDIPLGVHACKITSLSLCCST
jgi:hypothetical protein